MKANELQSHRGTAPVLQHKQCFMPSQAGGELRDDLGFVSTDVRQTSVTEYTGSDGLL